MGYETKMYIVEPYRMRKEDFLILTHDSELAPAGDYSIYSDHVAEDKIEHFFFKDGGNTKVLLPENFRITFKTESAILCQVIAMVDLCKASYYGEAGAIIAEGRRGKDNLGGFYAHDGNTVIITDRYKSAMSLLNPSDVLKAFIKSNKTEKYRRFDIAIATLKAAIKTFDNIKILFYGY